MALQATWTWARTTKLLICLERPQSPNHLGSTDAGAPDQLRWHCLCFCFLTDAEAGRAALIWSFKGVWQIFLPRNRIKMEMISWEGVWKIHIRDLIFSIIYQVCNFVTCLKAPRVLLNLWSTMGKWLLRSGLWGLGYDMQLHVIKIRKHAVALCYGNGTQIAILYLYPCK